MSLDGVHKNMIDLILIQQRWKSSVIDCRIFQSADVFSDHSLVLYGIRLRLKKMYYKAHQSVRTDVDQLKNEIIRKSYSNKLTEKKEKISPVDDLDVHARKIEDTIKETAVTAMPVKRAAKKAQISEETLKSADEKRTLKQTKSAS